MADKLTDAQVDALNQDTEVISARREFLKKCAEGFKTGNLEMVREAREVLLPKYLELFNERLQAVQDNPPVATERQLQKKFNGFGTRA